MSVSGLSSISSGTTSYDFTNMTPQQLLNAGSQLYADGKITSQENVSLMGMACASAPAPGTQLPDNVGLNSTTGENFVKMLQDNIAQLESLGSLDTGEQKSLAGDQGLLKVLDTYQTGVQASDPALQTTGTVVGQTA
jgi:hypothetical protein